MQEDLNDQNSKSPDPVEAQKVDGFENEEQRRIAQLMEERQQQKSEQNSKIGRPAKNEQEKQFFKRYMENSQRYELQVELLVHLHSYYFDETIENPSNAQISKVNMDKLFMHFKEDTLYRTLLVQNQVYYKNSTVYPEERLSYTSLVDVGYLYRTVKEKISSHLSTTQLLLIIFFHLYNQKLVNRNVYRYFVVNWDKLREGMIFGPKGQNFQLKQQKLDKLIICLALTIAQGQGITIEEKVIKNLPFKHKQTQGNSGQNESENTNNKRNRPQSLNSEQSESAIAKKHIHSEAQHS